MSKFLITIVLSLAIGFGSGILLSLKVNERKISAYESKIASLTSKSKVSTSKVKVSKPDGTITETESSVAVTETDSKVKESNRPKWTAGIGYTTDQTVELSLHRDLIYGLGMRLDYIPESKDGTFSLTFSY